jgi:hypothetical protein
MLNRDGKFRFNKRYLVLLATGILLGVLFSTIYVEATAPLSTIVISGGPYPGAPTWTIFTEAGTCYAKDANGAVAASFTSINFNYTANTALAATPYGGSVMLKALPGAASPGQTGVYTVPNVYYPTTSTILVPSGVTFYGENKAVCIFLVAGSNCDVVSMYNANHANVHSLTLFGNNAHNTGGNGLSVINTMSVDSMCVASDLLIMNASNYGVWNQQYPRGCEFHSIESILSTVNNFRFDSADGKSSDLYSGWSGKEGVMLQGNDYSVENVESWSSGLNSTSSADSGGIVITGSRISVTLGDSDRNQGAGIIVFGDNNTLTTCKTRDNGQKNTSPYDVGIVTFNGKGNTFIGCSGTNTGLLNALNQVGYGDYRQHWGYTEGGTADYNKLVGCDFSGCPSGPIDSFAAHSSSISYDTIKYGSNAYIYFGNSPYGVPNSYLTISNGTNPIASILNNGQLQLYDNSTGGIVLKDTVTGIHYKIVVTNGGLAVISP